MTALVTFPLPHGTTVTVVRGGVDRRTGALVEDERFDLVGLAFDPSSSAEQTESGDTIEVNGTLYGPFGMDIQPTDRVIVYGELYDVVGRRTDWADPISGEQAASSVRLVLHKG